MINLYDRTKFRTGDVVCTSSQDGIAWFIRLRTWGPLHLTHTDKGTHTGIIAVENGIVYLYEMNNTEPRHRYYCKATGDYASPDEWAIMDYDTRMNYESIVVRSGLVKSTLDKYENSNEGKHFCFVGRHPAFDSLELQARCTRVLDDLYDRGIPYDWIEIIRYTLDMPDENKRADICSRLNQRVFHDKLEIETPTKWASRVSPADWQRWPTLSGVDVASQGRSRSL